MGNAVVSTTTSVNTSESVSQIVTSGSIPDLQDYGSLNTQAEIRAAFDAFFADATATDVSVPALTLTEQYSRQLTDGQHKRLHLSPNTILKVTGNNGVTSIPLVFYTEPEWIQAVSSFVNSTVDLTDYSGDTDSTNLSAVLTLSGARTVSKHDLFKFVSQDAQSNGGSGLSNLRLGEFVTAGLDSTGTTVTLTGSLREERDTYSTTMRLGKMVNASVQIIGGRGDYDVSIAENSGQVPIMKFYGLRDVVVMDFVVDKSLSMGLVFNGCKNYLVENCTFNKMRSSQVLSQFGYGINDVASDGGRVIGCHGFALRHLFTTNSSQIASTPTDKDFWNYGRSRNYVVSGNTAWACSNSPFDTHNECDTGLFVGNSAHGCYDGVSSAGSSLQLRGDNVLAVGGFGEGSYGGISLNGFKNRVVGYTSIGCRTAALTIRNGDTASALDASGSAVDCRMQVRDTTNAAIVRVVAATAKTTYAEVIGGVCSFKTATGITMTEGAFNLDSDGCTLFLDNVLLDLTECASGTTLASIFEVEDSCTIKGKLRIRNTANCTISSIFALGNNAASPNNLVADLEIDYESTGTNGISSCTSAAPHGFDQTVWTSARIKLRIKTTGGTNRTTKQATYTSTELTNGATISLAGNNEEEATYRLTPAAELSASNAISIDATQLMTGHRRTFQNTTGFAIQFTGDLNFTLGNAASVTVQGTGTGVYLLDARPTYPVVSKTANYTTTAKDNGACLGLSHATGQTLTFSASTAVGTKFKITQSGAGRWLFAAASGATVNGSSSTTRQYHSLWAEVISNSDGSSAVWQVDAESNAYKTWTPVANSITPSAATTDANETTMDTVAIAGGIVGTRWRIWSRWSGVGTAGTKTARIKIGSSAPLARGETTNTNHGLRCTEVWCISSSSWKASASGSAGDFVGTTGSYVTGADDLTAAFNMVFTCQATAGDTLARETYLIERLDP